MSLRKKAQEEVMDAVARKLEAAGFWRRASARWLIVMGHGEYTAAQREWLLRRRKYCLAQISPPPQVTLDKLDICEVAKAANATLKRMGIDNTDGRFFRDYPR